MKSIKIKSLIKDVATAGTAEPLSATQILVSDFKFQPRSSNTGDNMYLGDSAVSSTTSVAYPKGGIYNETGGQGTPYKDELIDLSQVYIDGDADGDEMVVQYKSLEED